MADIAKLGIEVSTIGVDKAGRDMDNMGGAAKRAELAADKLTKATGGVSAAASMAAKAMAGHGSAAANASRQIEVMTKAVNQNNVALSVSADRSRNMSNSLRMATMQLSQSVQQVQAGSGVLQALAIQLPDLALGFGPIGIAAGAAAGALLTYFGTMLNNKDQSEAVLQKQNALIQAVADRWGAAYPALKAYADELQRAADAADLQSVQEQLISKRFQEIGGALDMLVKISPEVSRSLRDITSPEGTQAALAYQQAIDEMRTALNAGKDPADAFGRATSALATIIEQSGNAALKQYGLEFDILSGKIRSATQDAAAFRMQLPDLGTISPMWSENGKLYNDQQFTPINPPTPTSRPLIELEGLPKVRGAGRSASYDPFKSAMTSAQERVKSLQAETAAQAALNPLIDDYGFSLTKAKTSADLLAAAERAKKELTPGLIAQIDQTSTALARATAAQNMQAEAIQKAREQMDFYRNLTGGAISQVLDGIRQGESVWESFGDAAVSVLETITPDVFTIDFEEREAA